MGERLLCKQEVIGSIPFTSTIRRRRMVRDRRNVSYAGSGRQARVSQTRRSGEVGLLRGLGAGALLFDR